jgi:thiamine biosynthesis lipoprotein
MISAANLNIGRDRSQHSVLAFFLLLLLAGCEREPASLTLSGDTMGTRYHITWLPQSDSPPAEVLRSRIDEALEGVNRSMSTWREDSEISQFNSLPPGTWWQASAPFATVFQRAREVSAASDGAYDVTVAPLVDLWGFGPSLGSEVPAQERITQALGQVGIGYVDYDQQAARLRKQRVLTLDFSSIAKGYGVDVVAGVLSQSGLENYLVEIGGEIRVAGHSPRGGAWRIAVERPDALQRTVAATLEISDRAVATSGDYRNYFELDGVRYSHSIDPRSGWPVRHELVSVTVVHSDATSADAWATALLVLGPETALAVARRESLAVYLISRVGEDFKVEKTPELARYLR